MSLNLRDQMILESAAERLEELISACRARGPVYCIDPLLTADVTRKAKGLQTSLGKLRAALTEPDHQPSKKDAPSPKGPLNLRLHYQLPYAELARFLSYGGKRIEAVREKLADLRSRFAEEKVMAAYDELTMCEEKTHLIVLRPEARRLCGQLLGPAPESPDYEEYWRVNGRTPPAEHQPPPPEAEEKPASRRARGR